MEHETSTPSPRLSVHAPADWAEQEWTHNLRLHLIKKICFFPSSPCGIWAARLSYSGMSALCSCNQNTHARVGRGMSSFAWSACTSRPSWLHDLRIRHQSSAIKARPCNLARVSYSIECERHECCVCVGMAHVHGRKQASNACRNSVQTYGVLMSELWVSLVWYIPANKQDGLQVKEEEGGKDKKKKKKTLALNFNNVSYLNDRKWNYLAPAVFHSAPLLYICKAIYPLLLSNRATYPGSHLQTASEKKKKRRKEKWKCCRAPAETWHRSLWVLNCLNMHIMSGLRRVKLALPLNEL